MTLSFGTSPIILRTQSKCFLLKQIDINDDGYKLHNIYNLQRIISSFLQSLDIIELLALLLSIKTKKNAHRRKNITANIATTPTKINPCKITLLPAEILIQICSYLSPYELFLLRETCVRFNNLLDAPNSSTIQEIWKYTRKEFLKDKTNPPKGMSERD